MGLYDVIGDITAAQNAKTATGDNRIWGVVVGVVTSNWNENMKGRVCVNIPTRGQDKEDNILKWARVAMNSFGTDWGSYFLPEVGDEVLLVFENGDIEKPYVIGCIPTDKSNTLSKYALENNTKKSITTKHGSNLTFYDSDDDNGSKGEMDQVALQVASDSESKYQKILLDNDNEVIQFTHADGDTYVKMQTNSDKGTITMVAKKKLVIEVGDNIKITCDSQGTVSVSAKKISLETQGNIEMEGQQVKMKGSSSINQEGGSVHVKSNGMLELDGKSVKM